MKSIKFTEEYLEKVFEDNAIEDDNLFDCLKGREGTIEEIESDRFDDENSDSENEHMVLTIKLKMI